MLWKKLKSKLLKRIKQKSANELGMGNKISKIRRSDKNLEVFFIQMFYKWL